MAVVMKTAVDWYVKSCNVVDRPPKFGSAASVFKMWGGGGKLTYLI